MGNSQSETITKKQIESIYGTPDEYMNCIVNDVLEIIYHNKRYKRRPVTEHRNIESRSTKIAQNNFGINPYEPITKKEALAALNIFDKNIKDDLIKDIVNDIIDIVNNGKTYSKNIVYRDDANRGSIIRNTSIRIAKDNFGVDAYK